VKIFALSPVMLLLCGVSASLGVQAQSTSNPSLQAAPSSSPKASVAWPTRPVTIIVPFSVGGGTDIGTRIVAQKLSLLWGQSVVVDNRAGAGGNVGLEIAARAKPDGYTLLTGNVGTQSINPTLYKKLNYNPDTSFVPIGQFAELPFVLAVTSGLRAKTVKELVALAKAEPNSISYASSGYGGSPHLSAETFQLTTGTQLLHVPYKGGGAAMTDLISGTVQMIFVSVLETSAHIKAGKLRALAISSKERVAALPDVPTLKEAGFAGSESGSWLGLLAPAGTPKEIADKVSQSLQQVLAQADVQQQLLGQGALAKGGSAQDFAQLIESDRKRYSSIIITNKITLD
jgi:tripartite-type tricarboxylate transporter receptor subunit TctC